MYIEIYLLEPLLDSCRCTLLYGLEYERYEKIAVKVVFGWHGIPKYSIGPKDIDNATFYSPYAIEHGSWYTAGNSSLPHSSINREAEMLSVYTSIAREFEVVDFVGDIGTRLGVLLTWYVTSKFRLATVTL
jgi:hypothetical protein